MESMVKTREDGKTETHVGLMICKGPGRFRMVLTRPYHEAGRIVEIPREEITSIDAVAPGTFGETPLPGKAPTAGLA
jgi:hypothetical protein